jgi:hypothetical protein
MTISFGGPEGIRTLDLSDANRTRSQVVRKAGLYPTLKKGLIWGGDANHAAEGTHAVRNFFILPYLDLSSASHLIPDR